MRGQYAHCLRSVAVTVTGAAATAAPASGPVSPIGAFLRLRLVDELALGRDILLAHGEQQDLPHVFAERVGQPGRQLAPPARVERAAESAVLDALQPAGLAGVGHSAAHAVVLDVVDHEGQELLAPQGPLTT